MPKMNDTGYRPVPKNVQAIRDWYKTNVPSGLETFDRLLALDVADPTGVASSMIALALQGFEAGREFQKVHPDCESGPGYLGLSFPNRPLMPRKDAEFDGD